MDQVTVATSPTESAYTQVLIDRWLPVVGGRYASRVARAKTIGLKSFGLSTVLIILGLALYFPLGVYNAIVLVPGIGVGLSYVVRKTRMERALVSDMLARLEESQITIVKRPNFHSVDSFDEWLTKVGLTREIIQESGA